MTDTRLKTGIEWLAIFSRERRQARAKHGPTVYHHAAESFEFEGGMGLQPVWPQACRPGWTRSIVAKKYTSTAARPSRFHKDEYDWLLRLQGYRCYICMRAFNSEIVHVDYPTKDHVMPRCLGGGDYRNILLAHARCNREKKSRMPTGCELLLRDFLHIDIGLSPSLNIIQELDFTTPQEHTGVKQMLDVIR